MFGSRSGQVVGVVSHQIELALVEVVVPEVAVRDLELTSRRFGGPPCGGLDPLVGDKSVFDRGEKVGVRGGHDPDVISCF